MINIYSKYWKRDLINVLRYGFGAPLSAQRIYVNPQHIDRVYYPSLWREEIPKTVINNRIENLSLDRKYTGSVIGGGWDKQTIALQGCPKYRYCVERYCKGKSWKDTGAYDLMKKIIERKPGRDGCYSYSDIVKRYRRLDNIYNNVKRKRRLKSRKELSQYSFREKGGVYCHIGRNSTVIFAGGGFHRLAIAKILELESMPAQIGVVHKNAINAWQKHLL